MTYQQLNRYLIAPVFLALLLMSIPGLAIAEEGRCAGITCSGHGRCVVIRGEPACACESGYTADRLGINCIALASDASGNSTRGPDEQDAPAPPPTRDEQQNSTSDERRGSSPQSCDAVTCSGHGRCMMANGVPTCVCTGYYEQGEDETTCTMPPYNRRTLLIRIFGYSFAGLSAGAFIPALVMQRLDYSLEEWLPLFVTFGTLFVTGAVLIIIGSVRNRRIQRGRTPRDASSTSFNTVGYATLASRISHYSRVTF